MIFGQGSKPVTQFNLEYFGIWNTYIKMIQHELWSIVPRYDMTVAVSSVGQYLTWISIRLLLVVLFTLIEHEDVLFIVYAAWQLSFYERCDPVFGKIGRFVFTSGERLCKLRIWEHSSQDVTNVLVRFEGIMSAHRVENPQYLRLLGFWWRHKAG